MNKKFGLFLLVALMATLIVACGASPTAVPLPTQPPQVVTVVITATPPPATATPAQPTLTPVPTVAVTATVAGPTAAPTKAAVATKPPVAAASRTPTKPATPPTATALPVKYAAPNLVYPLWQPSFNTSQQDEVKYTAQGGSAMVFRWKSVAPLFGDECYRIDLLAEPVNASVAPQSDYFVKCSNNDVGVDGEVTYTLNNRAQPGPNYSSLIHPNANDYWVTWKVTVVKNLGSCTESFHCKTAPLSPASAPGKFLLKGS